MNYSEHFLQKSCVKYFRYAYPQYAYALFSVPNCGVRSKTQCRILKEEGMIAGVSDLILLIPRKGYGCLCIEMKSIKGYQEIEQKVWQQEVESYGNLYRIVRSFDEFKIIVEDYLGEGDGTTVNDAREELKKIIYEKK